MDPKTRTKKNTKNTGDGNEPDKKESITLSVDSRTLGQIRDQAKAHGRSVNSLVNDILVNYVMLYCHVEEEGSMIVPHMNFQFLIENIDEQKFTNYYANFCLDYVRSLFLEHNIPLTLENVIEYCYKILALKGGSYHEFNSYVDKEGYTYLAFIHSYGPKWSRIIAEGFSKQLEVYLNLHTEKRILGNNNVLLRILERVR